MTQPTTNRGWTYPTEYLDPYYDELFAMFEEIDQDVQDLIDGSSGTRKSAVIDYVSCIALPPSENDGDRYILDFTVGSVNGAWDGVGKGEIATFSSITGTWTSSGAPIEGWIAYVDNQNSDYRYVDDPTPAWEIVPGGSADSVSVDNSGWSGGPLDSKENVQESLVALIDEIARTTYDGTVQLLDSATSPGIPETVQLDIGDIDKGTSIAVQFSLTSGASTDTDLQFYDGDPSGSGVLLKEFLALDLVASALNDSSIWYVGLQATGALWVSVTNNTVSDSVYSLRLRISSLSADNLSVDNSGWAGNLSTETTVQTALDTLDGISLVGELSDLSDVGVTTKGNGRLLISDADSFESVLISGAITIDETGATAINATPKTVADDADLLLIYDNSASLYKQMTRANFLSSVGAPTIYDAVTAFTDIAASGGTSTVQLAIGAIDDGIAEAVQLSITAGTSADTTIQLFDGDPAGAGNLIYEAPNLDLVTESLDDRNCWYADLPTTGDLWVRVTNDGAAISSYSLRLRVKGDA